MPKKMLIHNKGIYLCLNENTIMKRTIFAKYCIDN